tara:strand:- start:418 stop:1959 length:1542 start_codon:yes stop_codon:yes gene_type:complete
MAQTLLIKRSNNTAAPPAFGNPGALAAGELAYSSHSLGNRLYIGHPDTTSGHIVIGGAYFTDMLDHTAGTLTAGSAIIVDANKKIDDLLVDNLQLNGNAIVSTDTNGDLTITPNGTGDLILDGVKWPQADGSASQFLTTDGSGQTSWASIPSGSFTVSDGAGSPTTFTFTTGNTLNLIGGTNITTDTSTGGSVTFNGKSDADIITLAQGAILSSSSITNTAGTLTIPASGVTAAPYGSASSVPALTVGADGRITGATNTPISITTSQIASFSTDVRNTLSHTSTGDGSLTYTSGTGVIAYAGPGVPQYRAAFSSGTGVTITSGSVAIGQAVGTSDNVTFNDLIVSGDLTVSGTTTTINTTNLNVEDPLISLGTGNTSTNVVDLGLFGTYNDGAQKYAGLFRDADDSGKWKLYDESAVAPTTTVNVGGAGHAVATLVADLESANVAITGGTITGITDLTVADGGTGVSSFIANRVLLGNGTNALSSVATGTQGQVMVVNASGVPEFASIDGGSF